jgi:O-antigen/teichoic acid export membrane protein
VTLWANLKALRTDGILRSVGILVGGSAISQGIVVAALPIVTRLYTPSDFSVLAVFMSLLSIICVAACLRFDIAIPIPQTDSDAINILGLALLSTVLVSSLVAICILAGAAQIAGWFNQPKLQPYLWLLPLGVLLAGAYSALQFWFVRKKEFSAIARNRIGQSFACVCTQLGFAWFGWIPVGLLLGQLLNSGAGCIGLASRLARRDRALLQYVDWSQMSLLWSKYSRFPKYSTFEALSNTAATYIPIVMIAATATRPEAGYLVLAMAAVQAPMALFGGAIAQVYLSRAPDEYRAGKLNAFTIGMVGNLLKGGVGPLIFVGIAAPSFFPLIFGRDWYRAGVLVAWMTPWSIMQFVSVPVSMALHVTGNQRVALLLQLSGLLIRGASVYWASLVLRDFVSEAYALSGFIFYGAYLLVVLRVVSAGTTDLVGELKKALATMAVWSCAGAGLLLAHRGLHAYFDSGLP